MGARHGTIFDVGLENSLWRAVAVYRIGALSYAIFLTVRSYQTYVNPALGWAVIAGMAIWTGVAAWAYRDPRRRRWPLLVVDLSIAVAALYSTHFVVERELLVRGVA